MWQSVFVENGPQEVKAILRSLQSELREEQQRLYTDIGEQYTDVIGLSERLNGLQRLSRQQQEHLDRIVTSRPAGAIWPRQQPQDALSGDFLRHADAKLGQWLAFSADRSVSRAKYAAAAQALFLAEQLGISSPMLDAQARRLHTALAQWLGTGTLISQSTYTALLVCLKCTPASLGRLFLQRRLEHIERLLTDVDGCAALFKVVDSASFIHAQIHNDLAQVRLLNRRLVETPTFAGSSAFAALAAHRMESARAIRCYPEECYSSSSSSSSSSNSDVDGNGAADIAEFTNRVAAEVSRAAGALLGAVDSVTGLNAVLTALAQQSQDVLSAEPAAIEQILGAFEPALSQRFATVIHESTEASTADNWADVFGELKAEIDKLERTARTMRNAVPPFGEQLGALEQRCHAQLDEQLERSYRRLRDGVLAGASDSIVETSHKLVALRALDERMTALGGETVEVPESCFAEFAAQLKQKYNETARVSRQYFGNAGAARAFELQCLIDEYLEDFEWPESALKIVREAVLDEPVLVTDDSLLLRPLAA